MPEQTGKIWKRLGTSGKDWETPGKVWEKPGKAWVGSGKHLVSTWKTLVLRFIYTLSTLGGDWRKTGGRLAEACWNIEPPMLNVEVYGSTNPMEEDQIAKSPDHQIDK